MIQRDEAVRRLESHAQALAQFSAKRLAIFGSVARGEAREESDIDVLVEFEPYARIGLFEFVRLQRFLSDILGCPVDLVTPDALREEMREQILREAVCAA
jgi:predicted nucleotidyltransferase